MNTLKQKLVTLLFLTAGLFSFAQVGIGTQTPKAALDVVSTTQGFLMPRMSTADRNAMTVGSDQLGMQVYDTDTNSIWTYNGGAWVLQQGSDNLGDHTATQNLDLGTNKLVGNGGTDGIVVAADGKVGIGTTNPSEALHIGNGDIKLQSSIPELVFSSPDGTSNSYYIGANISDSVNGGLYIGEGSGLPNNPRIMISNSGNVGIGTTTPHGKLDIADNGAVADGYGSISVTNPADANTYSYFSMTRSGNHVEAIGISPSGSLTFGGAVSKVNKTISNPDMVIDTSGNVGIGTSTPSEALDVTGNINFTGDLYQNGTLYSAGRKFVDGTTATDAVYTAGNVGIGTTTPNVNSVGKALHVHDSGSNGVAAIHFTNNATGDAPNDGLIIGRWNNGVNYISTYESEDIVFQTSAVDRVTVAANGNVGIGTSTPSETLDVAGTIKANTNVEGGRSIIAGFGGGSAALTVNDGYGNANVTFNHVGGTPEQVGKSARIEVDTDNTNSAVPAIMSFELGDAPTAGVATPLLQVMTLRGDGKVGIGTSSPDASAALDVSSTTRGFLPPRMTTAQRDAIASPVAGLIIYNSTTDALNFFSGSTNAWESLGGAGGALGATANVSFINSFPSSNYMENSSMEGEKIEVIINNTGLSNIDMSFATSDITLSSPALTVSAVSPASRTISPGQSFTVTYTLSGTPAFDGVIEARYSFNGLEAIGAILIDPQTSVTQNGLTYLTVRSVGTGEVWLDRNLGASRVATVFNDAQAYGDLYQWGRGTDGHEKRNSAITNVASSTDAPGHGDFIVGHYNWRSPQNVNLWQGVNGINNPCPTGYRVPTEGEFNAERLGFSPQTRAGAFASVLKLPVAGRRSLHHPGGISDIGSAGCYWTATVSGGNIRYLYFNSYQTYIDTLNPGFGMSVRCIKN